MMRVFCIVVMAIIFAVVNEVAVTVERESSADASELEAIEPLSKQANLIKKL